MLKRIIAALLAITIFSGGVLASDAFFESKVVLKRPTEDDHYRVPKIIQAPSGEIIVGAMLKVGHMRDAGGEELVHYRISRDDGATWVDSNEHETADVLDRQTGKFWKIAHSWPKVNAEGKRMSEAWMVDNPQKGIEIGAWMKLYSSADGGKSWLERDVTDRFFTNREGCLALFIGHGIQLQKGPYAGRLIIPGRYYGKKFERVGPGACNSLIYSDDHGETWQWGGASQGYSGEGCVVELSDGSVYLNNRNHNPENAGYRSYCISRDGGATFTEFGVDEELPESRCHAAIARHSYPNRQGGSPGRVLFLNPSVHVPGRSIAPHEGRKNITVKLSYDDCKTWPVSKTIHAGKGGYSDMIVSDKGTVICVFESGAEVYAEDITLVRFNIEWLESGFQPRIK